MKRSILKRMYCSVFAAVFAMSVMAGCGKADKAPSAEQQEAGAEAAAEAVTEAAEASETTTGTDTQPAEEIADGVYFKKGVYVNYAKEAEDPSKDYFYIFNSESYGSTEDGTVLIGMPFSCRQENGTVAFTFGGSGEVEDILTVTSSENGVITGHFDDGIELIFELIPDQDPDTFSAEKYLGDPQEMVYHDPNGWSFKYDSTKFELTQQDGSVFVVYQGDEAGSNLLTVTYDVEHKDGKSAIEAMGESWGDKTTYSESPFPGAPDVTGYWAHLPAGEDGSGLYEEAVARDFMGGALIFEVTGHKTGDEEIDIMLSDYFAYIFDTLEFD